MTITQDYQIEIDGVLVGNGTVYDLAQVQGFGIPPVRGTGIERANAHGNFSSQRELLQNRTLNLEIDVAAGSNLDSAVRTLRAVLVPSDSVRTIDFKLSANGFGDQIYRCYGYVRRVTSNIGENANWGVQKMYVQIECEDPRIYDADLSSQAFSAGASHTLNNAGNFPSPLSIDFHGAFTSVTLTNTTHSEAFYLTLSMGTSGVAIVNTFDETVLSGGSSYRRNVDHANSVWLMLHPGNNNLTFTALGTDGNTLCTVYWRNCWL